MIAELPLTSLTRSQAPRISKAQRMLLEQWLQRQQDYLKKQRQRAARHNKHNAMT